MTIAESSKAFLLFDELPSTNYGIAFITNRIIKSVDSIQDMIIPRCNTHDYPEQSFTINFQKMSKPDCCAYVYINGKNTGQWYSRSRGRAVVDWQRIDCNDPMSGLTDLGQVTVATPSDLNDFVKIIQWTWDFMREYKSEMVEVLDAN